jgi:hypothetical protein
MWLTLILDDFFQTHWQRLTEKMSWLYSTTDLIHSEKSATGQNVVLGIMATAQSI